jgi:GNAT superfamily N-acetyltransferase
MPETDSISIRFGWSNMKFDQITEMLKDAFWCRGINKEEVENGSRNSALLVGAFNSECEQVGFARAISDKTRFAYILDVIVREDYRRKGIGQNLIKNMIENEEMSNVYQWVLVTKDAHEVYKKVGFSVTKRPNDWMEIRKERPER